MDDAERRARELLAAEYVLNGADTLDEYWARPLSDLAAEDRMAVRALTKLLRATPPEPSQDEVDRASRAIFAVMYPYSLGHDYDSEFDNRRGEYMGIPVPSNVDKCREAARAALAVGKGDGNE